MHPTVVQVVMIVTERQATRARWRKTSWENHRLQVGRMNSLCVEGSKQGWKGVESKHSAS